MKKLKDKIFDLKQTSILECATAYFERFGYEHTKIADIAKDVGMSVGAFYKVFDSKDVLFNAYIMYQVGQFYDEFKRSIENESGYEIKLKEYIRLKFKYYMQKSNALESSILSGDPFFYHKAYSGEDNPMQQVYLLLMDILGEVLPEKSETELKFLAYTFHTMSDGAISLWFEEKIELEKQVDEIYQLFMHGMRSLI